MVTNIRTLLLAFALTIGTLSNSYADLLPFNASVTISGSMSHPAGTPFAVGQRGKMLIALNCAKIIAGCMLTNLHAPTSTAEVAKWLTVLGLICDGSYNFYGLVWKEEQPADKVSESNPLT